MRWWGPRGFATAAGQLDVRPGGAWRVGMRSPAGGLRWLRCAYRELVEPERLAFTWAWEDAAGEAYVMSLDGPIYRLDPAG